MTNTIRTLLIVCCALVVPAQVYAERWYEIELILFEQATEERLASENWDTKEPLPDIINSRDILSQAGHLKPIQQLCLSGQNYQVQSVDYVLYPEEQSTQIPETTPETTLNTANPAVTEANLPITDKIKAPEKPYQLLDKSEHELQEVYQQLRRRRGYRMLFHEAWRQPTGSKEDILPIRIYAGADYGDRFNYGGDAIVELQGMTATGDAPAISQLSQLLTANQSSYRQSGERFNQQQIIDPMMDMDVYFRRSTADHARIKISDCAAIELKQQAAKRQAVWQIDGTIHIYTERFRHVDTHLMIRFPDKEEVDLRAIETNLATDQLLTNLQLDSDSDTKQPTSSFDWQLDENFLLNEPSESIVIRDVLKYYLLIQSRRIIDSKIHYFDHPLMGMIIQLRSYDPDEESS